MANQTLTEAYAYAGKEHEQFDRNQDRWEFLLESYVGGETYRRGAHLTRYVLESEGEYAARLQSTPLDNHCKSIIATFISFLFREPAYRELGSIGNNPQIDNILDDADLDGRSFNNMMKEAAVWSSVFGHCWILVTQPAAEAQTAADQVAQGIRPYLSLLTPLVVTDWSWNRKANGRYELDYFKYIEDVNDSITTVREWTPEMITTWIMDDQKKEAYIQAEEVNGLGYIPAVLVYNQRSQVRGIGVSDIDDIADMQRAIYNELSEIEQAERLGGHPSLVKTPDTQVGSGAGSIIEVPENLDPGLKPYMLTADGTPINMMYESIKNRVAAIDKMANTGGVRATETRTLSGVAMEVEFQLLNARLSEKADNMELAEEQVWRLIAAYLGSEWNGMIEYPGSFNIRDTGREFQQLQTARAITQDTGLIAEIDRQLADLMGVDPEEVLSAQTIMQDDTSNG
jgi:hypothetical protein